MNVSLTPELEQFVEQKLRTGNYHDTSEVMREALELLKERDECQKAKLEDLRREIAIGLEQSRRGESAPLDMDAIIAEAQRIDLDRRLDAYEKGEDQGYTWEEVLTCIKGGR